MRTSNLLFILIFLTSCVTKNLDYYVQKAKDASALRDLDAEVNALNKADAIMKKNEAKPSCIGCVVYDADVYMMRAAANTDRDSFDLAAADYTDIIKDNPKPNDTYFISNLYYLRGEVYYHNLKDSLACKDWNKACNDYGHTRSCGELRKYCKR